MQKTEVVHTRISPETKNECDYIFSKLGITTSYAITLFLNQVVLRKGFPFDIVLPEEKEDLVAFAENVSSVDAGKPSDKVKQIMRLFDEGILDLETAELAIRRLHNLWEPYLYPDVDVLINKDNICPKTIEKAT